MSSPNRQDEENQQSTTRLSPATSTTLSNTTPNNEIDEKEKQKKSTDLGRTATGATGRSMTRTISKKDTILSALRDRPIPHFDHPLADEPTKEDVVVDFDGPDDPYRPRNWPMRKKALTTAFYGFVTMASTWASAAYSSGNAQVAEHFHVGNETAILGTTLFLIGYGTGPLLWAPLSELYGRRAAVLTPFFISICFTFGSATAKDFQTLMITRFFTGYFGSAPITNTGGVLGDLYSPDQRGIAMACYALVLTAGPILGPIASAAFVVTEGLGWRWTEYFSGILMSVCFLIAAIFTDESYAPLLLVKKARRLRVETGNWALHAKHEEWDVSFKEMARKFLIRPIAILFTPICFLVATYSSFCYGILYMQLGSIPIIFGEQRGWGELVSELPFLALLVGCICGLLTNMYNQTIYNKYYFAAGARAVPEKRLPPMMLGSFFFSGGQFIVGWTSAPQFPWIAPCIGLWCVGFGFFTVFQACLNYLVDTFSHYSASAIAANTILRSCFAGALPLVVTPMYHGIGVGPGCSVTGGFAALLIPVPWIFYFYGKEIRRRGKWSKDSVFD